MPAAQKKYLQYLSVPLRLCHHYIYCLNNMWLHKQHHPVHIEGLGDILDARALYSLDLWPLCSSMSEMFKRRFIFLFEFDN